MIKTCIFDSGNLYPLHLQLQRRYLNPLEFREQNKDKTQSYENDLETDYHRFLPKVRKAAKETSWMLSSIFDIICVEVLDLTTIYAIL